MTIQCFLSEPGFIDNKLRIDYQASGSVGIVDSVLKSYYSTPMYVRDRRSVRIALSYRPEPYEARNTTPFINDPIVEEFTDEARHNLMIESILAESTEYVSGISQAALGETLPASAEMINTVGAALLVDRDRLETDEIAYFSGMDTNDFDSLFNIVEYLTFGTISTDLMTAIDTILSTDTASFAGYEERSIVFSPLHNVATIHDVGMLADPIHRMVPRWFEFNFENASGVTKRMRIWTASDYYKEQYPYFDIIQVIPPFDPAKLVNPASLGFAIDELLADSVQDADSLKDAIHDNNQTGIVTCATRFEWNDVSRQVTFTLVYRGRVPSVVEQKNAIAEYLLATNIGGITTWNGLLPDVFIANSFFLIPMFHVVKQHQSGGIYYPSVAYPSEVISILHGLRAGIDTVTNEDCYLISIAYKKLFVGLFGNDDNDQQDLLELHPTYRDFSSTDQGFIEMSVDTRDFSVKLNQAIALAMDETNDLDHTVTSIDGFRFITFTHGDSAFNVMTQAHYEQYMESRI